MNSKRLTFGRRGFLQAMSGLAANLRTGYSLPTMTGLDSPTTTGIDEVFDCGVVFGPHHRQSLDTRPETVLKILDKARIGQALGVSLLGLYYSSKEGNRHTLQVCRQSSSRLIPCAIADPLDFATGDHLGRHLKEEGFRAVGFFPYSIFPPASQKWPLDYLSFRHCVEEIAEVGLPILINIGKVGEASQLAMMFAEVQTPIIVRAPGVGGYWLTAEYLSVGRVRPKFYFDVINLAANGSIELLVERLGADRLVFSSHTPFRYTLSSLYLVQYAYITSSQRAAIAAGTIRGLLSDGSLKRS